MNQQWKAHEQVITQFFVVGIICLCFVEAVLIIYQFSHLTLGYGVFGDAIFALILFTTGFWTLSIGIRILLQLVHAGIEILRKAIPEPLLSMTLAIFICVFGHIAPVGFVASIPKSILLALTFPMVVFGVAGAFSGCITSATLKRIPACILLAILFVLCAAGSITIALIFILPGFSPSYTPRPIDPTFLLPDALTVNPSLPGPYDILFATYGTGFDKRAIYGEKATYKSRTVDGSSLVRITEFNSRYFNITASSMPLNAQVWYPMAAGEKFPLLLIVHGDHMSTDSSEGGYAPLAKFIASHGFIVASLDMNFLNLNFFSGRPTPSPEFIANYNVAHMVARGWLMLEHLKLWQEWTRLEKHPLGSMVDMDNIALAGHSVGGEAVAIAALLNRLSHLPDNANIKWSYNFSIQGIFSIAGVNDYFRPSGRRVVLNDVSYFAIQGMYDCDVRVFEQLGKYTHVQVTKQDQFKATLYVMDANHGQFNSDWGRIDQTAFLPFLTNTKPIMSELDQIRLLQVYMNAFLRVTLKKQQKYLPVFKDYRAALKFIPTATK